MEEFVHCSKDKRVAYRSHAKLTCIFVNCDETSKSLPVVSLSASSLVVYCL